MPLRSILFTVAMITSTTAHALPSWYCLSVMAGKYKLLFDQPVGESGGMINMKVDRHGTSAIIEKDGVFSVLNLESFSVESTGIPIKENESFRSMRIYSAQHSLLVTVVAMPSGPAGHQIKFEIWNTRTGKIQFAQTVPHDLEPVFRLEGQHLVLSMVGGIMIFDLKDGFKTLSSIPIPGLPDHSAYYFSEDRKLVFTPLLNSSFNDNIPLPVEISLNGAYQPFQYTAFSPVLFSHGLADPIQAKTFEELNATLKILLGKGVDTESMELGGEGDDSLTPDALKEAFKSSRKINARSTYLSGNHLFVSGSQNHFEGNERIQRAFVHVYDTDSRSLERALYLPIEGVARIDEIAVFQEQFIALSVYRSVNDGPRKNSILIFPFDAKDLKNPLVDLPLDPLIEGEGSREIILDMYFTSSGELIYNTNANKIKTWQPLKPVSQN